MIDTPTDPSDSREPLEVVNEAQTLALHLTLLMKIALAFSITLALAVLGSFAASFAPELRIPALIVAGLSGFGLLVILRRAKIELFQLRLLQAQLYVLHKDKAHQTCGSMDPHFTQARP